MAAGRKTGGRDFKPGESGNPYGRPRLPGAVAEARKLNKVELERILNKYIYLNMQEMQFCANDPTTPAIDLIVIKMVLESIKRGDHVRLETILNRLVGKVADKAEITGAEGSPLFGSFADLAKRAQKLKEPNE